MHQRSITKGNLMRRIVIGLAALAGVGILSLYGCVTAQLPNVPLRAEGEAATPAVLAPFGTDPAVTTPADWTTRRAPLLRQAFAQNVYGAWPIDRAVTADPPEVLDAAAVDGAGRIEQIAVHLGNAADAMGFSMLLVLPANATGPVPLIITQNFCGNRGVFPDLAGVAAPPGTPQECGTGWSAPLIKAIFGDAIMTPPMPLILGRGYAVAMFYAGEVAPDNAATAEPALAALTPPNTPPDQRTGAVAAWAWSYLRAIDAFSRDPRIDASRITLWGHSRNGKAALLAAAMDNRPAAVVALQPGTAGGSLQRNAIGETIATISSDYPHWFAPAYAAFAGREADLPVDQHQLLALIAPRPVLLAGARRDQHSDPIGAVLATQGASPAYQLFGAPAFVQQDLRQMNLASPQVTYMRPGLHGVHTSDWEKILDFLDARLPPPAR
jgi:hypothetical protein